MMSNSRRLKQSYLSVSCDLQDKSNLRSRYRLGVLTWLLLATSTAAFGQTTVRDTLEQTRIDAQVGATLPASAEFLDHLGQPVQLRQLLGKRPLILCLVYFECPMLCKLAADGVVRSVASLPENVGEDFDVLFVSFDPRDTPASAAAARKIALRQYARSGANDGWHYLTGTAENIDQLTKAVGFRYVWDGNTKQFSHAAGVMIVSPDGVLTEYLNGVNFSPKELISAVNRATLNELTDRPSTSFVRCYLYDPTSGKFGAAVQWAIRGLGVATVLGLVAGVYRLNRRAQRDAKGVSLS